MVSVRNPAGAAAFTLSVVALGATVSRNAKAASQDYRFELAGPPARAAQGEIVQVRLIRIADGKPVTDAVIFETTADMRPQGMPTMGAPIKAMSTQDGAYRYTVEPGMAGSWAIHLSAKVQGEAETVHGTITADLVK